MQTQALQQGARSGLFAQVRQEGEQGEGRDSDQDERDVLEQSLLSTG